MDLIMKEGMALVPLFEIDTNSAAAKCDSFKKWFPKKDMSTLIKFWKICRHNQKVLKKYTRHTLARNPPQQFSFFEAHGRSPHHMRAPLST